MIFGSLMAERTMNALVYGLSRHLIYVSYRMHLSLKWNNLKEYRGCNSANSPCLSHISSYLSHLHHCKPFLYADDTALVAKGSSAAEIECKLNQDLEVARNWLDANKLSLNIAKTKVMFFCHPRNTYLANVELTITTGRATIEQVSSFKYLGLIVDNHLSFTEHCNNICKRVDQRTGLLWRIRSFIPESLALHLYNSLLHPHFLYCAHLYDGCNLTNQRRLQVSQNNALRAVLQAPPRCSTEQLHTKCKVDWLDVGRAKLTCIEAYKCLHGLNPPEVNNLVSYYNPA